MDPKSIGEILAVLLLGTGFVVLGVGSFYFWRGWVLMSISTTHGRNDGQTAADNFLSLLNYAERRLVIYDDGNKMQDSIYDNETVLAQTEMRMNAYSDLQIFVLFNVEEDIAFPKRMSKFGERFKIRYRQGPRPDEDVHFKIADDVLGYFSTHSFNDINREFSLYDASCAAKGAGRLAFAEPQAYFQDAFASAAAGVASR